MCTAVLLPDVWTSGQTDIQVYRSPIHGRYVVLPSIQGSSMSPARNAPRNPKNNRVEPLIRIGWVMAFGEVGQIFLQTTPSDPFFHSPLLATYSTACCFLLATRFT